MGEADKQSSGGPAGGSVRIGRLMDMSAGRLVAGASEIAQIETIFFASSNVQRFGDESERAAFRERWLGRYLDHWPADFFVASTPDRRIVGYLAGCLDDPAAQPRFSDLGYVVAFSDLSQSYPAHLHINLAPGWRSSGIGTRLIEAFCAHAAGRVAGVHVVTGRTSRNVRFYERNGFRLLRTTRSQWSDGEIAFLGRALGPAAAI
ncbi:MAG: GNAT family N-acetyltransferase [Hyphomicrobiaceae bacterium]